MVENSVIYRAEKAGSRTYPFLTCINFKNAPMSLKVDENAVWVSYSFDPAETPRDLANKLSKLI